MGQFETLQINQALLPEEKVAMESIEDIDKNLLVKTLKSTDIPVIETTDNKEDNEDLIRFSNFCLSYLEIIDTKINLAQLKKGIEKTDNQG